MAQRPHPVPPASTASQFVQSMFSLNPRSHPSSISRRNPLTPCRIPVPSRPHPRNAPVFSRSNSTSNGTTKEVAGAGEELPSPVNGGATPFFPRQTGDALLDDLQLQKQLAFLNEGGGNPAHQLQGFDGVECQSPGPGDADGMFAFGLGWHNGGPAHHRSSSVNELCLGGGDGFGWKPYLYYASGFCKNGGSCRFVQGGLSDDAVALAGAKMEAAADQQQQCQDFLIRSKGQRLGPAAFPYSPTGSLPGSPSAGSKCLSFLLIYGLVHDVRIPYQQKRMFGFVTFVYPETVKLILAKGNPHFICDARVLVKPYKEKGKVPYKYRHALRIHPWLPAMAMASVHARMQLLGLNDLLFSARRKQQQGDFSGCTTPTGGLDARDPFDLHQLSKRRPPTMFSSSLVGCVLQSLIPGANELLLRRKLEEQQQAAELQHAIELQSRRLMGLQLLDLKARAAATAAAASALPTPVANAFASSHPLSTMAVESPLESGEQLKLSSGFALEGKLNGGDKEESACEASPDAADSDQSGDHNLPDSPFASPTKSVALVHDSFAAMEPENTTSLVGSKIDDGSNHLRPPALEIPSPSSYFFPMRRCVGKASTLLFRGANYVREHSVIHK
ncbi:Zinc finger CCCH domain-containing protein 22 [Zea mays]|uniref:Zinc finger CCCH domain-containing protein 22 n=1 Tax=Zea mays TaxID=4577 RepID=A0A3L6FKV8_MAIZE|nr:Zinc finger CCCH domain-containing protein 22 [Zea mays]